MKRFPILGILLLAPALAVLGTVGCTKKDDHTTPTPSPTPTVPAKSRTDITTPPDAIIKGVVKFKGTPPEPKVDPRIAKADNLDAKKGLCGTEKDQLEQTWIVSKDGGVADVIVILAPPADKKFKKLDEKLLEAYKKKPVIVDQPYCEYIPHVVGLYAEYQKVEFKNDAMVNHNVKIDASEFGNPNFMLTPGKEKQIDLGGGPERIINASCSIHTWMSAKIALFNNPYFAVTDKDGNFEIKNVPIDTELTVYMWHETFGSDLNKDKKKDQKVKTKTGTQELKLEISK